MSIKILAIDQATVSGWAMSSQESGVWNLTPKPGESSGMRLIRFRGKLRELLKSNPFEIVVYERPAGFHKGALIVSAQLQGVILSFCEDNRLEYKAYSASEIKKYATGKGNCNKLAMVAAAKLKWPKVALVDDNHADALWLLDLAEQEM